MIKKTPIPEAEKLEFKSEFIKRYSKLTEWEVETYKGTIR